MPPFLPFGKAERTSQHFLSGWAGEVRGQRDRRPTRGKKRGKPFTRGGSQRKERALPAKARPKAECGGAAPAFSGPERGRSFAVDILSGGRGRSSGEQRDRPRKRRRAFRAKAPSRGLKAGKVIHIGGDFDGGRGNVIFRRRAKAGRCSKQRGNPHKLEEERGVFSVILETPKGPRKGFFRPREPGSGVVHRNPHEQVFLWITLWISG